MKGAFGEPEINQKKVGRALRKELDLVAEWLELDEVNVDRNGDLFEYL